MTYFTLIVSYFGEFHDERTIAYTTTFKLTKGKKIIDIAKYIKANKEMFTSLWESIYIGFETFSYDVGQYYEGGFDEDNRPDLDLVMEQSSCESLRDFLCDLSDEQLEAFLLSGTNITEEHGKELKMQLRSIKVRTIS